MRAFSLFHPRESKNASRGKNHESERNESEGTESRTMRVEDDERSGKVAKLVMLIQS